MAQDASHASAPGYTGRVGIFELMELNDEIRRKIMADADAVDLTQSARQATACATFAKTDG